MNAQQKKAAEIEIHFSIISDSVPYCLSLGPTCSPGTGIDSEAIANSQSHFRSESALVFPSCISRPLSLSALSVSLPLRLSKVSSRYRAASSEIFPDSSFYYSRNFVFCPTYVRSAYRKRIHLCCCERM